MIHRDLLLEAGYRQHPKSSIDTYDWLYQKVVYDKRTKLYFIDFGEYELRNLGHGIHYDARVQFTRRDGTVFNVTLLLDAETTIEHAEAFFRDVYANMGCKPYDSD